MLTYAGVCARMLTYGDVMCMQVRFPKNEDVAILIERMALYVSKHGHEFERAIINREKVSMRQHTSA